jgi:hypothetical protein
MVYTSSNEKSLNSPDLIGMRERFSQRSKRAQQNYLENTKPSQQMFRHHIKNLSDTGSINPRK